MTEKNMDEALEQSPAVDQEHYTHDVVTIVLTADNHLGYAAFGQPPRKREERRRRLRHAFQQATDFAIGQGVDLFMQAGDLFDTSMPDEQDRSFVAERLAQLQQAGIRTFALGGVHDTPSTPGAQAPAPQMSYARLGALHYFAPQPTVGAQFIAPLLLDIRGVLVGVCGLGVLAGQEGDPLAHLRVPSEIERAAISILMLHAPIEGLATGSSLLDTRAQVKRATLANQTYFRSILAGYHHGYAHLQLPPCDVVVAGATQHSDFSDPDAEPGFVFLGLAPDGVRWCKHIGVEALLTKRLVLQTAELWPENTGVTPEQLTHTILERLRPLCTPDTMVQLRLEGELTRRHYHQLDLNLLRHYGEEHCFALAIDDSGLVLSTPTGELVGSGTRQEERLSLREELVTLADEWIAAPHDEQEHKALLATKEELLLALDELKSRR